MRAMDRLPIERFAELSKRQPSPFVAPPSIPCQKCQELSNQLASAEAEVHRLQKLINSVFQELKPWAQ